MRLRHVAVVEARLVLRARLVRMFRAVARHAIASAALRACADSASVGDLAPIALCIHAPAPVRGVVGDEAALHVVEAKVHVVGGGGLPVGVVHDMGAVIGTIDAEFEIAVDVAIGVCVLLDLVVDPVTQAGCAGLGGVAAGGGRSTGRKT
jgi:hypothetical protein